MNGQPEKSMISSSNTWKTFLECFIGAILLGALVVEIIVMFSI